MPGIQDSGETHDPSTPSTPFSNPDVPMEEIAVTILHQEIQLLNQSEFKGNRDKSQLILLVHYHRQRPR
jgi:hypothetical protein